jgi:hypothetical protein
MEPRAAFLDILRSGVEAVALRWGTSKERMPKFDEAAAGGRPVIATVLAAPGRGGCSNAGATLRPSWGARRCLPVGRRANQEHSRESKYPRPLNQFDPVLWIALCPKQTLLTVRCASAMEEKFAVGQGFDP